MSRLGLPVPPGFIITTETCLEFFHDNKCLPDGLADQYIKAIEEMEKTTGRHFGCSDYSHFPLLLSIRSGAVVSMPGLYITQPNFVQIFTL